MCNYYLNYWKLYLKNKLLDEKLEFYSDAFEVIIKTTSYSSRVSG